MERRPGVATAGPCWVPDPRQHWGQSQEETLPFQILGLATEIWGMSVMAATTVYPEAYGMLAYLSVEKHSTASS